MPIHRVHENTQDYLRKAWEDKYIQAPFDKFNEVKDDGTPVGPGAKKGVHIYTSRGDSPTSLSSYKIRDENTGKILYQGVDPFEALRVANQKTGANIPMPLTDWNDGPGAKSNLRIYYSNRKDGSSYRVKNTKTDKVLGDFKTPRRAYEYANRRARVPGEVFGTTPAERQKYLEEQQQRYLEKHPTGFLRNGR